MCNYCGIVKQKNNYLQIICQEEDIINQKMLKNILKKIKRINLKNIVLAERLEKNEEFKKIIKSTNCKILDGTWLYRFLAYDIVNKIAYIQNTKIGEMEITILLTEDSEITMENIKFLAKECKIVNILTNKVEKFEVIERYLFDEYGIVINVSSNKKKTCKYSRVVLNFDFTNKMLKQCSFGKNSIIVQFNKQKFENKKGVNIVFYKLEAPLKYLKVFGKNNHFSEEILYESFLYYKTSFENMRKILEKDNIHIRYFYGNNGKIDFREISNKGLDKFK